MKYLFYLCVFCFAPNNNAHHLIPTFISRRISKIRPAGYLAGYPASEAGYPAGYRILKKAGYPAGRISGETLVLSTKSYICKLGFINYNQDC